MSQTEVRLRELGARVERLAVDPDSVEAPWTARLTRPFYRLLGWQPELSVVRVDELLAELRRVAQGELDECADELERALVELEQNVEIAERACVVNGRLPLAQSAWLSRMTRVLGHAAHALRDPIGTEVGSLAELFDPVLVAPPLSVARVTDDSGEPAGSVDVEQARLVELQLAAIDHVIAAARTEKEFLARRRSLLEAARRLLLDADAAMQLDVGGVRVRKQYLTEQIVHVDRLQACGLSPHVSVLHQARSALARGERDRLYAALVAMDGFASAAGDLRGANLARRALERMGVDAVDRTASASRSARQVMGDDVVKKVEAAYAAARTELEGRESTGVDDIIYDLTVDFLGSDAESATLSALLSVDGAFDVGAPLAPVRIEDRHIVARVVSHPTQELMLTHAQGAADVPSAVIQDPRGVLLDLAAGRLLARKYVRYEERTTERVEMMGEVRVYLLDGSTSMMELPARARMRDAIVTAELATLMSRFRHPDRYTRVLMFYRYFTKRMWPLHRVSNAAEALAAIGDVVERQWDGGTDIEEALVSCFDLIRSAREDDRDLARAQVVLITDGEARVEEAAIRRARERAGEIPIAVSVIALGEENVALRRIVARQRARGERAFYHHIDDETLVGIANGTVSAPRSLHLPDEDDAPMSREQLEDAVGEALQEASELERDRHRGTLNASADLGAALEELGLDRSFMSDGQRARQEVAARDRRALETRYLRWFPRVVDEPVDTTDDHHVLVEHEDAMVVVLTTVAEVLSELHGDALSRRADAIDVLERLLPDARLSPGQYDQLVQAPSERVAEALAAIHNAVDPQR